MLSDDTTMASTYIKDETGNDYLFTASRSDLHLVDYAPVLTSGHVNKRKSE